jgi:catechol 2,3-dioxygenase-like lactoylglutathione lyase family enzyme
MIKELEHVAVRTSNMEAALHFYADILGGKIIRDTALSDGTKRHIFVQIANGVIELLEGGQDGLIHAAFRTDEQNHTIEEVCDALRSQGFEIINEPSPSKLGNGKIAAFRDVSGVSFELVERAENFRVSGLENKHILEFEHIYVRLFDDTIAKCREFYTGFMGFKLRAEFLKGVSRTSYYSCGSNTLAAGHKAGEPKGGKFPLEHICLRVKDIRVLKAHLESRGIECPEPVEASAGGFQVMKILGPAGETVEFLDRESLERYQSPYTNPSLETL